ncbi:MAG: PAS domain S-box protein, partial [Psychroserpens sp.]|nr:PAS domain S-box protein [Psychroserpens sp.]
MLKVNLHRLLRRQIRKAGLDAEDLIKFKDLFNSIDQAYRNFDDDVKHIEVIFEESSNELYKLNQALKSKVDNVENELNTIVNTIGGVIFKTNLRGDFLYLNHAWEEVTHFSTAEAIGQNFKDFLIGDNESVYHKVKNVLREGNKQLDTFFKYYRKDGEEFWIQLKLDFIRNNDGKISGTIGTMTDITQLKQTEIELNRANKVKDEFLSMMSHEIRTPLNSVIGTSVLLLMNKSLPEQSENLKVLKHSSEHLLALINDLLDLNKYKSKEIKLDVKDFNLSETVQNLQLEFSRTSQHKNLKLDTVLDGAIPSVVKGDNLKLSQVLKNLLSNAFKFTNEGTVTFKVEQLESKYNEVVIRFTVSDTGIGVSYDKQKDIFKSFVQAHEDTSKLYGGTGLGLYICKQLLKLQGSSLELKSEKGRGS